jgi:predicted PurR-regulated permease PerM
MVSRSDMHTGKYMTTDRQALCGALFSLCVVALAAYVASDFLVPVLWAAILATATWRLYLKLRLRLGKHNVLASALATLIVATVFLAPLLAALREVSKLVPQAAMVVSDANAHGVPAPAFLGRIPFAGAYLAAAGFLAANGNGSGAIAIAVWGSVVLFVADHFIRPRLIGEATRMPFLLVLFGIFGGVQAFGLVGLFAGPAAMALFITL